MITEIAQIEIKPGMEPEFEAGVKKAAPVFQRAKGCHGMELQRSLEKPSRYRLFVSWDTLENHTVDFRGSPDFHEWRKLVGHCFLPRRRRSSTCARSFTDSDNLLPYFGRLQFVVKSSVSMSSNNVIHLKPSPAQTSGIFLFARCLAGADVSNDTTVRSFLFTSP
jgi:heme-degrading monooxygenase HmoA